MDAESPGAGRASLPRALGASVAAAVCVLTALLVAVALTRSRLFTSDSMNYVDVARHVAAGDGLVQSAAGFNQPYVDPAAAIPAPFTAQPPLYPLAIAAGIVCGLDGSDAALVAAAGSVGLALWAGWCVARRTFGDGPALVALGALALFEPLLQTGNAAWSDAPGAALALAALAAAVRATAPERPARDGLVAGVVAGLAFATRYALLPFAAVGAVVVAAVPGRTGAARRAALFGAGFAVVGAPVVLRNLALGAGAFGPARLPTDDTFAANAALAAAALTDAWLPAAIGPVLQRSLLAVLVGVTVVALARRGGLRETLLGRGRWTFLAAAAATVAALVVSRSSVHFDAIDARLTLAAGAALVVWLGATLGSALRIAPSHAALVAIGACGVGAWRLAAELRTPAPQFDLDEPRIAWLRKNTGPRDLVLGEDTVDVPYRIPGRRAVSFSRFPYTERPTAESLLAVVRAHRGEFDRFWLVVGAHDFPRDEWRRRYGEFIDAAVHAPGVPDPAFVRVGTTGDALIFEIRP